MTQINENSKNVCGSAHLKRSKASSKSFPAFSRLSTRMAVLAKVLSSDAKSIKCLPNSQIGSETQSVVHFLKTGNWNNVDVSQSESHVRLGYGVQEFKLRPVGPYLHIGIGVPVVNGSPLEVFELFVFSWEIPNILLSKHWAYPHVFGFLEEVLLRVLNELNASLNNLKIACSGRLWFVESCGCLFMGCSMSPKDFRRGYSLPLSLGDAVLCQHSKLMLCTIGYLGFHMFPLVYVLWESCLRLFKWFSLVLWAEKSLCRHSSCWQRSSWQWLLEVRSGRPHRPLAGRGKESKQVYMSLVPSSKP